ncbi:hypothetical protein AOLI_G00232220 [Acnodon oligacanthus]
MSNCPFTLAAALARGTADSILQSDLSVYYLNKNVEDGTETIPQIEAVKLARLVFNKLCETCCLWLKGIPTRRHVQPYYETSIHAIKNMRRKMEDRHVVIPDFNTLFNLQGKFLMSHRVLMAGDSEHKPYICGDADHITFPLDGTEDYLILACDGFYDTVSPDEAARVVSDHLQENSGDTTMVAHKLVASARDAGSSDNITVIVVFLRDPRAPPPSEEPEEEGEEPGEEPVEEEAEPEQEEEEEEEETSQSELVCQDGGGENGGKSRAGWPLQQCSAPADLAYEDRMDSFTDRTSLSITGPEPFSEKGCFRMPPEAQGPPVRTFWPDLGAGGGRVQRPHLETEGYCGLRHQKWPKSQVPSFTKPMTGQWLEASALFPQQGRRKRRMEGVVLRREMKKRRILKARELRCPSSPHPNVPYPLRCTESRPGVALPRVTHD